MENRTLRETKVLLPDVSVIIPTFNRADRVCNAVETCIIDQNCAVEVIVVDDGSTDDTKKALWKAFSAMIYDKSNRPQQHIPAKNFQKLKELPNFPKVFYFFQTNQGVSAARNLGLQAATGQYVKFLDSDDELIAGILSKELCFARKTNADVVVTGWQERTYYSDLDTFTISQHVPAPNIERGIDDMLLGKAPWTAAALYRREFISKLKWNCEIEKAEEWAWAWDVCLAGASFKTLNIESSIYNQHSDKRITSEGNPFLKSTQFRQRILRMVENQLKRTNRLTIERRCALSQYYYKDRLVICENSIEEWHALWMHCRELAPGYRPKEWHPLVKPFVNLMGGYWGVRIYVVLKRWVGYVGFRRN